jgi:hypothetical protein
MQHAHVKRKESPMNRYILEEFHSNPALVRRVYARASRERSRVLYAAFRVLHAAFAWLRERLTPRVHLRPGRWIDGLG